MISPASRSTDTGPGIAPEIRDHVFERFAQYGANGYAPGSAGLGLAIVKDIVEAHGGRIFVESNNGHGSRFIVQLPASRAILMARLLIVDDEKNIRLSLVRFFDSLGHQVSEAENGAQASAMLAESALRPGVDGFPDGRDERVGDSSRKPGGFIRTPS